MKKLLLCTVALLAMVGFSSCSKEEVKDETIIYEIIDIKDKTLVDLIIQNPEIKNIKNLKITGNFSNNDLLVLQNSLKEIENLDLSETKITELGHFNPKLKSIIIPISVT